MGVGVGVDVDVDVDVWRCPAERVEREMCGEVRV